MFGVFRQFCAASLLAMLPASALAADACLLCGARSGAASGQSAGAASSQPPIEIELTTGFNFRRFAAPGPTGEVLVDAARSAMPGAAGPGDHALVGQVLIRGAPNAALDIVLPQSVALTSKQGDRVEIARIAHTLPQNPRLDSNGRLEFSFSGPLTLPANATPGDYQASFSIEATYE